MRIWLKLAISIGLILPIIAFIVEFKHLDLRQTFGFYLLLLIVQIATEQIFSHWMPSLVVPIGTLYTAFRVWQLWQGLQMMRSPRKRLPRDRWRNGVLWVLLCFWISNLVMLLTLGWASTL